MMRLATRVGRGRALVGILCAASLVTSCGLDATRPVSIRIRQPATPEPLPSPSAKPQPVHAAGTRPVVRRYIPGDYDKPPVHSGPAPIKQIGSIEIPRIGLYHPIFEGIELRVINHGPGHWPGSAMPGRQGNAVFPGHRVTHTHPFLHIDDIQVGDKIIYHMHNGTFVYKVTKHFVITPDDTWVAGQGDGYITTIMACHPPHSARYRYVVQGELISPAPPSAASFPDVTPAPSPTPHKKKLVVI